MSQPVKVLIVDDSSSARAMLRSIVETDPGLQVMGTSPDAFAAARQMRVDLPDVLMLDIEMPGMDGITFLKKVMTQHPLPVVICSSLGTRGSQATIAALEAGALDVILKPSLMDAAARAEAAVQICQALHAAARSKRNRRAGVLTTDFSVASPKLTADEILPPPNFARPVPFMDPVVCIGASTGGTEALREVLQALPADAPPIAIVQHMPAGFTNAFARRLDGLCAVTVAEAQDMQALPPGTALIAPGDHHLVLRRGPQGYRVSVLDGPCVSRHRPSVDVLFRSAASVAGPNALGIIMTGMGDDGARCLDEMRRTGAPTIAQDEASCVVYGMPREAVKSGAALHVLPLDRIAGAIMNFARRHRMGQPA